MYTQIPPNAVKRKCIFSKKIQEPKSHNRRVTLLKIKYKILKSFWHFENKSEIISDLSGLKSQSRE